MVGDTDPKHTSLSGLELFQQLKHHLPQELEDTKAAIEKRLAA